MYGLCSMIIKQKELMTDESNSFLLILYHNCHMVLSAI